MKALILKSAISSFLLTISTAVPLTAVAETIVFSGRDAFGYMNGYSPGGTYMSMRAFETASKSQSVKEQAAGATLYGRADCLRGIGSTTSIEFMALGAIPRTVSAFGTAEVIWTNWCADESYTEEVTFNMSLSAMTDQTSSTKGAEHYDYGEFKVNSNYNDTQAPANVSSESYISSPRYGLITPSYGVVGQSKTHEVQIIKP